MTVVCRATQQGHLKVVRQLVGAGADKSVRTQWGTPLELARRQGHQNVVDFLVAPLVGPVTIVGSSKSPELNGCSAQALGFSSNHQRYVVELEDGSKVKLKAPNLRPR